MLNEKEIKLTINKLWNEMKNLKLEQNNAIYSLGLRASQIMALMKVIKREDIFSKAEIDSYDIKNSDFKPNLQHDGKQLTLEDMPIEELQNYINNFKKKPVKTINKNIQKLEPKERV
jgi:hypothetical protein